jgi:hypothetical protein
MVLVTALVTPSEFVMVLAMACVLFDFVSSGCKAESDCGFASPGCKAENDCKLMSVMVLAAALAARVHDLIKHLAKDVAGNNCTTPRGRSTGAVAT